MVSGYSIAVKLLDLKSAPLAAINKNFAGTEKTINASAASSRAKMAVAQADVRAYGFEVRKLANADSACRRVNGSSGMRAIWQTMVD
jgi:hypothetical protein